MEGFRKLTRDEIAMLKTQMCSAEDWDKVEVAEGFSAEHIRYARFSGNIRLGAFRKKFALAGGMIKHSGIYYATVFRLRQHISWLSTGIASALFPGFARL